MSLGDGWILFWRQKINHLFTSIGHLSWHLALCALCCIIVFLHLQLVNKFSVESTTKFKFKLHARTHTLAIMIALLSWNRKWVSYTRDPAVCHPPTRPNKVLLPRPSAGQLWDWVPATAGGTTSCNHPSNPFSANPVLSAHCVYWSKWLCLVLIQEDEILDHFQLNCQADGLWSSYPPPCRSKRRN